LQILYRCCITQAIHKIVQAVIRPDENAGKVDKSRYWRSYAQQGGQECLNSRADQIGEMDHPAIDKIKNNGIFHQFDKVSARQQQEAKRSNH
jgi:hypothetical protein